MLMVGRLKNTYTALSWSGRFYWFSVLVSFIGLMVSMFMGLAVFQFAILLASLGFIAGFSVWFWRGVKWMASMWDKPFGKTPIVILNLTVLLVSTVHAR